MPEAVYKDEILVVEPHGIEHIKLEERHGKASKLFNVWFASNMHLSTWTLGALAIILGLDFWGAVFSILIGNLLGAVGVGLAVTMGPPLGMPQMVTSRASFGYKGNYLPSFLAWVGFLGWFTVNNILGGEVISQLTHMPYVVSMLVLSIVTIIIAIYGYNLVHGFEWVMTLFSALVFIVMTVGVLVHGVNFAYHSNASSGQYWINFFLMLTIAFSYTIGWSPYAADYGRYLDKDTPLAKPFIYTFLGLFVSISWIMIVGIMFATIAAKADPIAMIRQIMGWFAVIAYIALALGSMSSNVLNIYSGSLSALTFDLPLKRWGSAILIGGVSIILSLLIGYGKFVGFFKDFLLFLSYWITPWLGIQIAEFYLFGNKGKQYTDILDFYNKGGVFGSIKYEGLVSYLVGLAVSIPFMASTIYTGPIGNKLGGADISYFVAFFVSALLYCLFSSRRKMAVSQKMNVN